VHSLVKRKRRLHPIDKKAKNQQNLSINFKLLQKYVMVDMTKWLTASKRQ
jgi:hypothetical protein